jgi:glycosyltransferase involved in cell wall biosynthesis
MQFVDSKLLICGDGNFIEETRQLVEKSNLGNKIEFTGMLLPDELKMISQKAYIGIAIAEKEGLNQWLALPNKFFDYIHAGVPQVTMNYPEYNKINEKFEVAVLINDLDPQTIAGAINNLLANDVLYERLRNN